MSCVLLTGLLVLAAAAAPQVRVPVPHPAPAPVAARAAPEAAVPGVRYALIPPRNLSGVDSAPAELLGRLERALAGRGASFVPAADIDLSLREHRVRYTDSLSARDLAALARRTGASHTLLATIFDCTPGVEPRISFTVRALDNTDGRRALSCAVALRGVDFEGLLGLGRIEDLGLLADEATLRLLEDFDEHGAPRADGAGRPARGRPEPPEGGTGFMREEFDPRRTLRVAILPFADRSGHSDATAQFTEFLGTAWFREAGVQVLEASDLRAALIARKVRSMQYLDLARLGEIGRDMGVRYFVLGSIDRFGDEVLVDDDRFPEVEASVQLVDTESARIVAAAAVSRRGSDYQTLLGLRAVRDPAELALRAAREIVIALGG